MKVLEEVFHEPPRSHMLPDFVLDQVAKLAVRVHDDGAPLPATDPALIRQKLSTALGVDRIPRFSTVTPIGVIEAEDYTVEKFVFEATPGLPVPALLYLPKTPGPHPAVVHPPGHWMEDAKLAQIIQHLNIRLARSGIASLCYDTIGQGERRVGWHQHGQLAPLLVGFTSLGLMVRDTLSALDILDDRDDIQSDHLGLVGASGGGFSSIFAAAIDDRVSVAVISSIVNTHLSQVRDAAYGTGWDSWVDLCNQVPGLATIGTMGEILATISPRTLLVANGTEDPAFPLVGAQEVAAELRGILATKGTVGSFTFAEVPGGHGWHPEMRTVVAEFLVSQLLPRRDEVGEDGATPFQSPWPVPHNLSTSSTPRLAQPLKSDATCLPEPVDSNEPVVELALELAHQLEAHRPPLTPDALQDMLGPFPARSPLCMRVENHVTLDDLHAQRLTVRPEPGIELDAVLLLPKNWRDTLSPVLVVLDEGGKSAALNSAPVDYARSHGWAVLLPDLRGTGESAVSEFEVASATWLTDRDLLNQRTWDVLRLVDFLQERNTVSTAQQVDLKRILVWGNDSFGLVGLLAAAIDDRIAGVGTAGIDSLKDLLTVNVDVTPMAFHFNMLAILDLPDLRGLISPRPAVFGHAGENSAEALRFILDNCE